MKIIDLLNKIANGEDLRFKLINDEEAEDDIFEVENGYLRNSTDGKWLEMQINCDNWKGINRSFLNQEVEIIEEEKKIPEKLPIGLKQTKDGIFNTIVKDDIQYELNEKEVIICKKIHEIIDYLKSKEE